MSSFCIFAAFSTLFSLAISAPQAAVAEGRDSVQILERSRTIRDGTEERATVDEYKRIKTDRNVVEGQ